MHVFENDTGPDDANHAHDGLYVLASPGVAAGPGPEHDLRDVAPTILDLLGEQVPPDVADLYAYMCPAGVYERDGDKLIVNAPNCIDCKATDVLGPRWTPREGGSGPSYKRM